MQLFPKQEMEGKPAEDLAWSNSKLGFISSFCLPQNKMRVLFVGMQNGRKYSGLIKCTQEIQGTGLRSFG